MANPAPFRERGLQVSYGPPLGQLATVDDAKDRLLLLIPQLRLGYGDSK